MINSEAVRVFNAGEASRPRCCFYLPFPPSANTAYPTNFKTKKRFKSKKYQEWLNVCLSEIGIHAPVLVTGRVVCIYTFGRPDKRRRDVENYVKPVSDLLVAAGIIEDDSLIDKLTIQWGEITGCKVEVQKGEQ